MAITQNKSIGSKAYNENFDKIFGTKEERKAKADKEAAEFAELEVLVQKANKSANVGRPFEPFISPIDGKEVRSPTELRAHNKKHEVTDMRDYSPEYFERKQEQMKREMLGNTPQAKKERQQLIEHQLHKHGIIR